MKCLFTNILETILFKKSTNFSGTQLENSKERECEIFRVVFLNEPEDIPKFSNLHWCTFNS